MSTHNTYSFLELGDSFWLVFLATVGWYSKYNFFFDNVI